MVNPFSALIGSVKAAIGKESNAAVAEASETAVRAALVEIGEQVPLVAALLGGKPIQIIVTVQAKELQEGA